MIRLWMIVVLSVGCATEDPSVSESETCEDCLEVGGGWESNRGACVVECLADEEGCSMSECGPVCEEECSGCLGQEECLGAGCVWIGSEDDFYCAG